MQLHGKDMKVFLLVALPLAVAAIFMQLSTSSMLSGISDSVNQRDQERNWQVIQSAFGAANERLRGTVVDNAHWDDAALNSYGKIDPQWMFDTWGVATTDVNYDTIVLVDADGNQLTAFHNGEPLNIVPAQYFGDTFVHMLQDVNMAGTHFSAIASLAKTPDGIASVAIAPVLPINDDIKLPQPRPNFLLFARHMSASTLDALSKQYVIENLTLGKPGITAKSSGQISDNYGQPVATAMWTAMNPGDEARKSYSTGALNAILALIATMLPISTFLSRTMKRLELNERRAKESARIDLLSGLPNRMRLLEDLTAHLASAKSGELALAYIDLDGFKSVNDTFDHATGDKLLCLVSNGLSRIIGNRGLLARLGGDEFAFLMSGPDIQAKALSVANEISRFVQHPFKIAGKTISIGASIGIALNEKADVEAAEFMRRADIAMYTAKDAGRNGIRLFDTGLDNRRNETLQIAEELTKHLSQKEFGLVYQPIVKAGTREIQCVEMLARWPIASDSSIPPDRFIPVAEEHGLIDELGMLLLNKAMSDLATMPGVCLAVNLSAAQLNNLELVNQFRKAATLNNFDLSRLEVEFTESVMISNPQRIREVIAEFNSCGVQVALDDFGAGYASVGYLRQFAFNKIKLDRSLTQQIEKDPDLQRIVQGTILIAKGLSACVVAEGIETESEAKLMYLAGCTQLQGYYFGRPKPVAELRTRLSAEKSAA